MSGPVSFLLLQAAAVHRVVPMHGWLCSPQGLLQDQEWASVSITPYLSPIHHSSIIPKLPALPLTFHHKSFLHNQAGL